MYTEQLSQCLAVVGSVIPATSATGSAAVTEAIDISKFRRVLFVLQMGAIATSGASQILVQGATASGATYTTITSLSSNVLTASGVTMSEATMENIVSLASGFNWLKGVANVTGANVSGVNMIVFGADARWEPASQYNTAYTLTPVVF